MSNELHVNKGGMMSSASNKRISTVYFPVFDEGKLIGNLTGDDLKFALNSLGFDIVDLDSKKTEQILKSNGINQVYTDLE